jgi:hypothetical protein
VSAVRHSQYPRAADLTKHVVAKCGIIELHHANGKLARVAPGARLSIMAKPA